MLSLSVTVWEFVDRVFTSLRRAGPAGEELKRLEGQNTPKSRLRAENTLKSMRNRGTQRELRCEVRKEWAWAFYTDPLYVYLMLPSVIET